MHKAIICSQIPVQGTPHPHARVFKNFVFTSAIAPLSVGSVLPPVGFQAQAQLVMEHLKEILRQAKTEPSRVFKLTVLLSDMRYLDGFYEVWQHAFPGCFPVISVYAVPALQGVYDLEIDAMALSRDSSWTISPIRTANAHRTRGAFPQGVRCVLTDYGQIDLPLGPDDCAVVMSPGHKMDFQILTQVLKTEAGYIGCIGSRRKVAATRALLLEAGFSEAVIDAIHSPIGLPIGGETPEEIAVSVAAELIAHRSGRLERHG